MFYVHEMRNLLRASNFRTPARPAGFENFWLWSIGGSGSLLRHVRSTPRSRHQSEGSACPLGVRPGRRRSKPVGPLYPQEQTSSGLTECPFRSWKSKPEVSALPPYVCFTPQTSTVATARSASVPTGGTTHFAQAERGCLIGGLWLNAWSRSKKPATDHRNPRLGAYLRRPLVR